MKKKTILLLLTIILGIGISLASVYYMYYQKDIRENSLQSKLISIDYVETNNVILSSNVPVVDEVGLAGTPYEFTIKNTSKIPLKANIKIETTENNNIPVSAVRYGLYINDELIKKDNIKEDKILYTIEKFLVSEEDNIKIYFWVDYYYEEPNKTFEAKIKVDSESTDVIYKPVRVNFDANGGTVSPLSKEVGIGINYGDLPTPLKEGYAFNGWTIPNAEYQELEYIESNGTQYIDTGVIANQDTKTEIKFNLLNDSAAFIYGARQGVSNRTFTFANVNDNYHGLRIDYNNQLSNYIITNIGEITIVRQEKNKYYINEEYIGEHTYTEFTTPGNMYLFNVNNNGTIASNSTTQIKLYTFKIWDSDTLIRDFVPVKKVSTGEIGLLDAKNNVFYGNLGEGTFISGPPKDKITSESRVLINTDHTLKANWVNGDVTITLDANGGNVSTTTEKVYYNNTYGNLPTPTKTGYTFDGWTMLDSEYKELEYIESTGTQYIDTGVIANQDTGFDIDFIAYNALITGWNGTTTGYGSIFGSRTGPAENGFQLTTWTSNEKQGHFLYGTNSTANNIRYDAGIIPNTRQQISFRNRVLTKPDNTTTSVTNYEFETPYSIVIFGKASPVNDVKTINEYSSTRLYSFKFYDGNTLIKDFIPVLKTSTGEIGLLDKENNVFYGNLGTGEFVAGPLKEKITNNTSVTTNENHALIANWISNSNTPYVVKHYTENLDGAAYTLHSTDNLTGITNQILTVANLKKSITGFTYAAGYTTGNTARPSSGEVTTATILPDGSRVINLYYTRNSYKVNFNENLFMTERKTENGVTLSTTDSHKSEVTLNGNLTTVSFKFWSDLLYSLSANDVFEIKLTYVSGSFTKTNTSKSSQFVMELVNNGARLSDRTTSPTTYQVLTIPAVGSTDPVSTTYTIPASRVSQVNGIQFWFYQNEAGNITFTDYTMKVEITKVSSRNIKYGATYATLPTPSKTGFQFKGWYTELNGGTQRQDSTTMTTTSEHTLWAHWDSYALTLKYHVNGGSITTNTSNETQYRKGSDNLVEKSTDSGSTWADAFTYAYPWTRGLNLTDVGTFPITKTGYKVNATSAYNTKADGTGVNVTQDASTTNEATIMRINGSALTANRTVNLYVNWVPKTYTVTLNNHGATNTPTASVTATYNSSTLSPSSITVPQIKYTISGFTKDGTNASGATVSSTATLTSTYTFNGWYTAASGGSLVLSKAASPVMQASVSGYTNSSSKWIKDGIATLHAQWTGQAKTLPTIKKSGYTCGWSKSKTATNYTYASGGEMTPTADTVLYGICKAS